MSTTVEMLERLVAFSMEWRTIPGVDPLGELAEMRRHVAERIEPAKRAVHLDAGLTLEPESWSPGLSTDPEHPLVSLVTEASGIGGCGKVSYATEAGVFHGAGIATVVRGPGHIAQAHKADEWIARSELDACDRFIRAAALRYAGAAAGAAR